MAPTHYEVLGVARTASAEQVRAAYRAAARDHHPDAGGDPDRMRAINAAWRVLGDPGRRAAYDRQLSRPATGAGDQPGVRGTSPSGAGWVPDYDGRLLSAEELADLADGRPIGQTMALAGWWAILPPGTLMASLVLVLAAFYFSAPVLLAMAGGMFILALGLFVLAPLRAMAKKPSE